MMLEWTEEDIYLVAQYAYELHLEGYNYDAAVIFEGLLAINPDNTYCRDALAALSLALGRPEDAARRASEVLELRANHADSLARRCEAFLQLERIEDAKSDLEALRRMNAVSHSNRMQLRVQTVTEEKSVSMRRLSNGSFSK